MNAFLNGCGKHTIGMAGETWRIHYGNAYVGKDSRRADQSKLKGIVGEFQRDKVG